MSLTKHQRAARRREREKAYRKGYAAGRIVGAADLANAINEARREGAEHGFRNALDVTKQLAANRLETVKRARAEGYEAGRAEILSVLPEPQSAWERALVGLDSPKHTTAV